jgi:hypothetical protein
VNGSSIKFLADVLTVAKDFDRVPTAETAISETAVSKTAVAKTWRYEK